MAFYFYSLQGKMLSKYFSKALVDANIVLPEVEVRDLHFLADPKSCGWINKQDFLKVMVRTLRNNPTQPTIGAVRVKAPAHDS